MPKQFQTASKDTKVVYLISKNRNDFFYETLAPNPYPPYSPAPSFWGSIANAPRFAGRVGVGRMQRLITFLPILPTNSICITR